MAQLTIDQAFRVAIQHHQAGRLPQAEQLYRQILAQQPNHIDALHRLGVIAAQVGRNGAAVELIGRAIALSPLNSQAHSDLGNVLQEKGQLDEAIAAYRRAIALKSIPEAHYNLGRALHAKGQLDEAIAAFRQAIALNPKFPEAHNDLGNVLIDKRQVDEAIAAFGRAISIRPNYAQAYGNLGIALRVKWQPDQAIAAFQQAIALKPDFSDAMVNMGNALKDKGQLDDAMAAYRRAMTINPRDDEAHSNLVATVHYHPGHDAMKIAEEQRLWNRDRGEPLKGLIQPHANDRNPDRRLRIGYVSPDFCAHVVGRNVLPLFHNHDRREFDITCYANVLQPDAMTAEFQRNSNAWRNIVGLSDEQMVNQIRQDKIDILVDLSLHTARNRLPAFARKPAPVQATFAGYPGSTGLTAIDYRLSDPYLDPPGMDESIYSEKTIRLSDSFWCYDPLEGREIQVNAAPAQEAGVVTFGCLNNFCKVNEVILGLWARVMSNVPNSRLLLLAAQGSHRQRTIEFFARQGVDPARVEFLDFRPRQDYFQMYHRIDLGLDSFPYNGHTTSLDSFWMGVPVVTLVGQTAVSRAGWCQLSNLGLTELAGRTPEKFVQIATELASDPPRLSHLRLTLRQRMEQSSLMDAPRFARNIEAAYRTMWRTWCSGAANSRPG